MGLLFGGATYGAQQLLKASHSSDSKPVAAAPVETAPIVQSEPPIQNESGLPVAQLEQGAFGLWPIAAKPQLMRGDTGDAVRYLQSVLRFRAAQDIEVDGTFGPATETAVKSVQALFGADVDGVVGPDTWVAIDQLATGT